MIITTTNIIEGKPVKEYKGIVFGEVVNGVNFIRDISAGIRNIVGGRSGSYEKELIKSREDALQEMRERAAAIGANAVVGVGIDYESLGGGGMLMVTASGTAVVV